MLYANRHHRFLVLASVCLMVCSLDSKAADLDLGSVCDPSNGTEPDVKQRLEDDAARIELAAGQEIAELSGLLKILFLDGADTTQRLEAAEKLTTLPAIINSPGAKRAVGRRTELVLAAIEAVQSLPDDADRAAALKIADELVFTLAVDVEAAWREFYGERAHQLLADLDAKYPKVADELSSVIHRHYGDHNLRIIISEPMAAQIVNRPHSQAECISDCVLGARVTGSQFTSVQPDADILPSTTGAKWMLIGRGTTTADTRAAKGPATICGVGDYRFTVSRMMSYDGAQVFFHPASISADVNNRNIGLSTKYDRVPLLRGIVRGIAWRQANRKLPQSEAIAERKLKEQALPAFEKRSRPQFEELNTKLNAFRDFRRDYVGQLPTYAVSSTDQHIFVNTRTSSPINWAAGPPPAYTMPTSTLTVQLHESLINSGIDGLGQLLQHEMEKQLHKFRGEEPITLDQVNVAITHLKGREFLDRLDERMPLLGSRLRGLIEAQLDRLILPPPETIVEIANTVGIPKLDITECDPVRVRIDEDGLVLVRKSYPRKNPDVAPKELVLRLKIVDGQLSVDIDQEIPDWAKPYVELARARLDDLTKKFRERLKKSVREMLNKVGPGDLFKTPKHLNLTFVDLQLSDGWLSMELDATVISEAEQRQSLISASN